tara:strand:- start:1314 stop:1484 length:171 start_codon:yes stop_codon:yes gene_type:complete
MSKLKETTYFMLRMTKDMHSKVRSKADELGITMTAIIKLCINKFIDDLTNEDNLLD